MKKTIITTLLTLVIISNIMPCTLATFNGYRNPLTLFTWDTGTCLNDNQDGFLTTPLIDPNFAYISYRGSDDIKTGDKVLTINTFNPLTLYHDDFVGRFDFIYER